MFRGKNAFLSNMSESPIKLGAVEYTCAEAAFQAAKLENKAERIRFAGLTGKQARILGRQINLRKDWNEIRIPVMRWILTEKFKQNPALMENLLKTSDDELVEENTWNDKFWGTCNGQGENNLGKLLKEIKDEERKRRDDAAFEGYIMHDVWHGFGDALYNGYKLQ